jgi:hypothetical protein
MSGRSDRQGKTWRWSLMALVLLLCVGCGDDSSSDSSSDDGTGSTDDDFLNGSDDSTPVDLAITAADAGFIGGTNEGLEPTGSIDGVPLYTLDPTTRYTLRFPITNSSADTRTAVVAVYRTENDEKPEAGDQLIPVGTGVTTLLSQEVVDILPGGSDVLVGHAAQGAEGAPGYGPADTGTVSYRIDIDVDLRVAETDERNNRHIVTTRREPVAAIQ